MKPLVLILALLASTAWAQNISGPASVIDGDTIEVSGQRIRLWGIDAPELHQTCRAQGSDGHEREWQCGEAARWTLQLAIGSDQVICKQKDVDRYHRIVATCKTALWDLGAVMVASGHAIDYERYSHGAYAVEQKDAQDNHQGIWSGRFTMPAEWRKARR